MPIADARERLLALIDALFACFDANRDLLRIHATGTQAVPWRTRQQMGDRIGDIYHHFIDWVAGIARDARRAGLLAGVDPDVFARVARRGRHGDGVALGRTRSRSAASATQPHRCARSSPARSPGGRDEAALRARRAGRARLPLGRGDGDAARGGRTARARHRGGGTGSRVSEPIPATGSVLAEKTTEIGPRVDGLVEEVAVRVGDRVAEGQPIFRIRAVDYQLRLAEAEAALRLVTAEAEKAARDRERVRTLHEKGVASHERLDQIETGPRDHTRTRRDRTCRRGDRPPGGRGLRGARALRGRRHAPLRRRGRDAAHDDGRRLRRGRDS